MRKGAKAAVIGSVFAVMVGGAGYGAFNIVNALDGGGAAGPGGAEPAAVKSGPPSGSEVKDTSAAFFAAWTKGQAAAAADLTNNAARAEPLLASYGAAHITGMKITPGKASGAVVPYKVEATVSYEGKSKPLSYASRLTVVRGVTTGKALVDWQPSVVHPQLKNMDDTLVTGASSTPSIEAVDRDGKVLTKDKYPSLGPILDQLRDQVRRQGGRHARHRADDQTCRRGLRRHLAADPRRGQARQAPAPRSARRCRRPPRRRCRSTPSRRRWRSSPAPARCWRSPTTAPTA